MSTIEEKIDYWESVTGIELSGKHEIDDEDDLKRVVDRNSEMLETEGEDRLVISQATACLII